MFKKIGLVALVVVGGLFLLNRTNLGSYASTAWKKVRQGACNQVPLEFEVERVRHEISQLVPDMKDSIKGIAEESVAVENLRDEIVATRATLAKQKEKILVMRQDLETNKTAKTISYGNKEYSVARIRERLAKDFESYKHCEESLQSKEKLLETREAALATEREKLANMRSMKEELEVQVAQLEADVKNMRLANVRSNVQVDDSRLARIKSSIASIRDRLKADKTAAILQAQFGNDLDIQVEKKIKTAEVIKEIDDHFGKESKSEVATDK